MSAREALMKFCEKDLKKSLPRRKNNNPEDSVKWDCLLWFNENGFDGDIYEAKGGAENTYGVIGVIAGHSDWAGNNETGRASYVEFKAPGRRSTLKAHQREFLMRKINTNCFVCCVDSPELLEFFYRRWLKCSSNYEKVKFLTNSLPQKRESKSGAKV